MKWPLVTRTRYERELALVREQADGHSRALAGVESLLDRLGRALVEGTRVRVRLEPDQQFSAMVTMNSYGLEQWGMFNLWGVLARSLTDRLRMEYERTRAGMGGE